MPIWITLAQWVARLILLLLGSLSVWSISIIIERRRTFKTAWNEGALAKAKSLVKTGSPAELEKWAEKGHTVLKGAALTLSEAPSAGADRALRGYLNEERARLEKGLGILATLGSNAPFIGLFGTVLGIIQAFGELAESQKGTQGVMAAISEALVATAIGLFVAIPAVIAYNHFSGRIRVMILECETLRDWYLSKSGTR